VIDREGDEMTDGRAPNGTSGGLRRARTAMTLVAALLAAGCGDDASSSAPETEQATPTSATLPSIPLDDGPPLEPGTYRVSSEGQYDGPEAPPVLWSCVD